MWQWFSFTMQFYVKSSLHWFFSFLVDVLKFSSVVTLGHLISNFIAHWSTSLICLSQKKVWGSKWNERAYFSTRKVKLDHDYLSMSVLVQEVINADYAFVIHTTNPTSGDSSEIYTEVWLIISWFFAYASTHLQKHIHHLKRLWQ